MKTWTFCALLSILSALAFARAPVDGAMAAKDALKERRFHGLE